MGRSRPSPVSKQRERAQRRAAKHKVCVCGGGGAVCYFCWKGYKNNSAVLGNEPIRRNQAQDKELFPPPPRSRWVMEEQHVEGNGLQEQR